MINCKQATGCNPEDERNGPDEPAKLVVKEGGEDHAYPVLRRALTMEVNRPSRRPDAEQRRGSRDEREHGRW